jgi:hypothetical protein
MKTSLPNVTYTFRNLPQNKYLGKPRQAGQAELICLVYLAFSIELEWCKRAGDVYQYHSCGDLVFEFFVYPYPELVSPPEKGPVGFGCLHYSLSCLSGLLGLFGFLGLLGFLSQK